jgi:hypothetical protein
MRDTRSDFVAAGFDTSALRDRRLLNVPVVAATLLGTTRPTRRQLRPNPQ